MITFWFTLLLCPLSDSTKIWIPNTDINNKLNWDKLDTPKDCDDIRFLPQAEVAAYWNLKRVVITGLALPETGDVIFPRGVNIRFRDKDKCPRSRDLVFVRNEIKGWLDPDNWKSDSEGQWLPHSERVPCAGESILFPPERTFAVQLPDILIPTGDITFDNEVFRGDSWSDFLRTELGFQLFRGPDNVRSMPWRNDVGCSSGKKCICGRSSYSIRDGYLDYLFLEFTLRQCFSTLQHIVGNYEMGFEFEGTPKGDARLIVYSKLLVWKLKKKNKEKHK